MITFIQFVLILILLFFTIFTAASEIAIIAVSRLRLRKLASEGSKRAKIIQKILEAPEKFFSTILVVNDVVTTLIASIVTVLLVSLVGEGKGVIIAAVVASIIIIISEVAAKTVAAAHSERIAFKVAKPLSYMIVFFAPIVQLFVRVADAAVRFVGAVPKDAKTLVTEDEIKAYIKIGEEEGVLHADKYKMLSKVFDFSNKLVKSVMTPKKEVVAIDINSSLDDIIEKVLESGYSRFPVYKDSPDLIIGVINMKDILNLSTNRNLVLLQDIIYPAAIFSENKKVSELLKEFQKGHTHLGTVVDEKGNYIGIVTIEDLLEEIVGEIEDEYDTRASYYKNPK
ncbi:MAG: hemolysin family protein [Candidatus Omnitrophota bacterium]